MENNSDKVQKDENKAKKNGNNTKRAGACGCAQVFEMAKSQVGQNASNFWTLSYCLKQFFEEQKALPVCRLTADFAADTKSYLELQKIYNEKAERDERRLRELLGQLDVHPSAKLNVSQEEIKCFCKNAANLKVTQ